MAPRPVQPETAFLATKISPEILDIILSDFSYPHSDTPSPPTRSPGRTSEMKNLGLVSHGFSVSAARYIWRNVVLTSDAHTTFVQDAIEASGGQKGRVGSCIRTIFTAFRWTRNTDSIVTLAASCHNLIRLDAPVLNLTPLAIPVTGSVSIFHHLQELVIYAKNPNKSDDFRTSDLVGLAGLKRLTIYGSLEATLKCPPPTFSLNGLVWRGKYQPAEVRWILQNSPTLQLLEMRRPSADFLEECLAGHGSTMLSLRLPLQGTISDQGLPALVDTIQTHCPNLRELWLDNCPDPLLFGRLPLSIKHIGLKPARKTSLFNGNTLKKWVDAREELIGISLWGNHADNLHGKIDLAQRSKHARLDTHIKKAAVWKKSGIVKFVSTDREYPWGDDRTEDYISSAFGDYRCK